MNTTNSFGYTPLLEACHRGFQNIVELLVKGGADLKYIPPADKSNASPFVSAPAQTALSESARCGFHRIVQVRFHKEKIRNKKYDDDQLFLKGNTLF